MTYTLLASLGLMIACALVHYEALRVIGGATLAIRNHRRAVLVVIFGVVAAHLTEITLYAAALWLGHRLGLGSLTGIAEPHGPQYFFLSAETYTTLGMGDVYPSGDLRLIAALEPLIGMLLIGWSGSYTYGKAEKFLPWNFSARPVAVHARDGLRESSALCLIHAAASCPGWEALNKSALPYLTVQRYWVDLTRPGATGPD